jgi:isopenicillin-N epimerase
MEPTTSTGSASSQRRHQPGEPGSSAIGPPPPPFDQDLSGQFQLDSSLTFLNHGSFGSCPKPVLAFQRKWQDIIEARPIEMLGRRSDEMLNEAKSVVGLFLGAREDDVAFVTNATDAVNAIVRSLEFRPGDELLTTNHVYGAVRKTLWSIADRTGAKTIEADVKVPIAGPRDVVAAVEASISQRTRLLVIDHVTSPTALVYPVQHVTAMCRERGIDVLVDGAHAPGMVDLNIESMGATFYVGNLHKWVCAPKGAGFIWVAPEAQHRVHPTVTSHHYGEGYKEEFSWQGTRDFSPWIASAEAIRFMGQFDWKRIRAHNHALAVWVQQRLCALWNVPPASPIDGSMLGSMVTVQLPRQDVARNSGTFDKFGAMLYDEYKIEAPIIDWEERWWVRCSCQVYNTAAEYEKLGRAVLDIINKLERA